MLPDRSMREMISSGMRSATAMVETQAPASSVVLPPSVSTATHPALPVLPVPEDELWLVLLAAVSGSDVALQPHHAVAMQARVKDTKRGLWMRMGRLMEGLLS